MSKTLIIGGVAGGASCAARLRRLDEKAEIIIFERGEYISYANCGLPYHVGGVITDRDELLLQTPELMRRNYNIDARVRHEVLSIDRPNRRVQVMNHETGDTYWEGYDQLVIATGSSPLRPPIPGIDSERVHMLWTLPDTDRIRAYIAQHRVQRAAVIGGGFIGLEMAENLHALGIRVTLVEMLPQVLAPLDQEMAQLLHGHIRHQGVELILGDGVSHFEDTESCVRLHLQSGRNLDAEMVILSIGVRPNGELAKAAGLPVNSRGGILTDSHMRTEDPAIYAVGDAVEVLDGIFREPAMVPLAGPANKQGRIAADNIAGREARYADSLGTSVVKVFDMNAAGAGMNEKALIRRGLQKGRDYQSLLIVQNAHAGYYPGAERLFIKLLFSIEDERILGAQIVGRGGVDKRIDSLAILMKLNAPLRALEELELAYAPPFSSAKDPVNMAGYMAANVLEGLSAFAPWDAPETEPEALLLDVREPWELEEYAIPGAVNIPLGELRERLSKLDKNQDIIVLCAVGLRAHNAARLLSNSGFQKVRIYPGGAAFHQALHDA